MLVRRRPSRRRAEEIRKREEMSVISWGRRETQGSESQCAGRAMSSLCHGHSQYHPPTGTTEMSRYLIVIESTGTSFSAYSPDLPGCVATGTTRDEVESAMHESIEFHIEGLRLSGYPIPKPSS